MPDRDAAQLELRLANLTEKLLGAFEELDFMYSLAQVLAAPEGVTDLDAYLLEETLAVFRADGGWIARTREDGRLEATAIEGFGPESVSWLDTRILEPMIAARNLPYLVDDLPGALARRAIAGLDVQPPEDLDLPRAFLSVPLAVGAQVLGVINLGKRSPGDVFASGDQKLLSTLAVQAALFILNASRVDRLRAEARTLGRRVEQLEADRETRPDISWIRGPSETMKRLAAQVETAAGTDATVLLLGESGTGKSLIARLLHDQSGRRAGPFVELNCGAVPPSLIESELFGHARGAFTGAETARAGLFEEADGGTILLDEVAELPVESQVKLLTVLEQQRVRRVGENRDRQVDARVIAATNADLGGAVGSGRFREDLFYRLNVISLTVPPLRQREEDIVPLARRFLTRIARETNRRITAFSPEAEDALRAHPWPGNVRELRNVVERSLLLKTRGDRVEREDLPLREGGVATGDGEVSGSLPEAMQATERRLILGALRRHRGVVAEAARSLGISRTNLHNKLRKHKLTRTRDWQEET